MGNLNSSCQPPSLPIQTIRRISNSSGTTADLWIASILPNSDRIPVAGESASSPLPSPAASGFLFFKIFATLLQPNHHHHPEAVVPELTSLENEREVLKRVVSPLFERGYCYNFVRYIASSPDEGCTIQTIAPYLKGDPDAVERENRFFARMNSVYPQVTKFHYIITEGFPLGTRTLAQYYEDVRQIPELTQGYLYEIIALWFQCLVALTIFRKKGGRMKDASGSSPETILLVPLPRMTRVAYEYNGNMYIFYTRYRAMLFDFTHSYVLDPRTEEDEDPLTSRIPLEIIGFFKSFFHGSSHIDEDLRRAILTIFSGNENDESIAMMFQDQKDMVPPSTYLRCRSLDRIIHLLGCAITSPPTSEDYRHTPRFACYHDENVAKVPPNPTVPVYIYAEGEPKGSTNTFLLSIPPEVHHQLAALSTDDL